MKTLKKVLAIVLTLCSITAILTVGASADGITVNLSSNTVYPGYSYTMTVVDSGKDYANFTFEGLPDGVSLNWTGWNGTYHSYTLTVESNVIPNTYNVKVTDLYNETLSGEFTLTVSTPDVAVTGLAIVDSTGSATMYPGATKQLSVNITPSNATNKNVKWSSSDPTVLLVADNGSVTALKAGSATITATSVSSPSVAQQYTITVSNKPVTSVTVTPATANITVGGQTTLTASVLPVDAGNANVYWGSSNTAVAVVNNGVVTGISEGSATITATATDGSGCSASCNVTVSAAAPTPTPTSAPSNTFAISETAVNLTAGSTKQLYTRLDGADTTSGTSWSSTDTSVATVVNGKVTAKKAGTATITALFDVGGTRYTAYSTVTVTGYYVQHQITYGNYSTFDGKNPMYFITNDIVTNFKGVAVDGYTLTNGNQYYATSSSDGHILVALNPAYVKMLSSASAHTIQIGSTNGIAQGYFKLYGTSYNIYGVKTGDESNPGLWAALCLMAFVGATAIVIKRRKDLLA